MILTLTANPAIDRTISVDRLAFEDRAYVNSSRESAGGRGINAACVIKSFGGAVSAMMTAGGATGARLRELLKGCGFPVSIVPIDGDSRTNLTITDKHGLTVNLNEPGPKLTQAEVNKLEKTIRKNLDQVQWLLLCGSLPPGVPADFYGRLVKYASQKKVNTLLDADGEALRDGIEAHPTVVTPNQQEAERLLNRALLTRGHFVEAVDRIHAMGAKMVVLSLGSRGAIGKFPEGAVEALAPRVDALCPIGSGDALAAAFAWALAAGKTPPDALRWGVAVGTASAKLPGTTLANFEQASDVYRLVEVRRIE